MDAKALGRSFRVSCCRNETDLSGFISFSVSQGAEVTVFLFCFCLLVLQSSSTAHTHTHKTKTLENDVCVFRLGSVTSVRLGKCIVIVLKRSFGENIAYN